MPGPVIRNPWADSVVDAMPGSGTLRTIARFFGGEDPQSQVVQLMMPMMPVGQETAGPALRAIQNIAGRIRGITNLASTIQRGTAPDYLLKPEVIERLRALHRYGLSLPNQSNWAGTANEDLLRAFGGDQQMAERWARLWGANSPNTDVPRNTAESISALLHFIQNPNTPMTYDIARGLDPSITMAGSKVPNMNRAWAGEPLRSGGEDIMKVEAMAQYLLGNPRIPIDVHALYALLGEGGADELGSQLPGLRKLMNRAEGLPARTTRTAQALTNTDIYARYEDALRRALQEFDPKRSINQIFAELWEGARAHKGEPWEGGPIDILRKKGLLGAGAMLDPAQLRAALSSKGWSAAAIAGLIASLGASQGTGTPGTQ